AISSMSFSEKFASGLPAFGAGRVRRSGQEHVGLVCPAFPDPASAAAAVIGRRIAISPVAARKPAPSGLRIMTDSILELTGPRSARWVLVPASMPQLG